MRMGTRSVLFGAHQFGLHPWFVAAAWWRLCGFPWDPRLWVAFAIHDLGYIGKPNMDGPEGERHPEWAARLMGQLFGHEWHDFYLLHSRFYAKALGRPFSRLCVADKLAIALTPSWLYLRMVQLTGELADYRQRLRGRTRARVTSKGWRHLGEEGDREWHRRVQDYCRRWAFEHHDGREDTWTPRTSAADGMEAREVDDAR
jgi:hypothetical protein